MGNSCCSDRDDRKQTKGDLAPKAESAKRNERKEQAKLQNTDGNTTKDSY